MSAPRRTASALMVAALAGGWLAACGAGDSGMGETIGDYGVVQGADGLEIRSLPDQHPNLNALLAKLGPSFEKIGLPSTTISATSVIDRGILGNETEWPRRDVARVAVQSRQPRGPEAKIEALDRSWRVLLLRADGKPLRRGFGFSREIDARAFAAVVGTALGVAPEDEEITESASSD